MRSNSAQLHKRRCICADPWVCGASAPAVGFGKFLFFNGASLRTTRSLTYTSCTGMQGGTKNDLALVFTETHRMLVDHMRTSFKPEIL